MCLAEVKYFVTPNLIFMLHITQLFIFISSFVQKKHFFVKFDLNHGYYYWGPCEKCVPHILSWFGNNVVFALMIP